MHMPAFPGLQRFGLVLTVLLAAATVLLPSRAAVAQNVAAPNMAALSDGVVRITAVADGVRKTGTGFIVQTADDAVYIATASHVVEGDKNPKVTFHAEPNTDVDAQVLKLEGGDPKGLALVVVRNNVRRLLRQVQVLQLAMTNELNAGDSVTAIGFPQGGGSWAMVPTSIASREGRDLVVAGNLNEGNSGGPLLKDGVVVGLVTGMQGQYGRATPAPIVRIAMEGWGVKLGAVARAAGNAPPQAGAAPGTSDNAPAPQTKAFRASVENGRVEPASHAGECPVKLSFTWTVKGSDGPGRVTYQFVRSDSVKSPRQTMEFKGTGGRTLTYSWSLGRADVARSFDGWVAVELLEPQGGQAERVPFHVECTGKGADSEDVTPDTKAPANATNRGSGAGKPAPGTTPGTTMPAALSVTGRYAGQQQGMNALGQTYACAVAVVFTQVGVDVSGQFQNTCGDAGAFGGQIAGTRLAGMAQSRMTGTYCDMIMDFAQNASMLNGQYACLTGERGSFTMIRQ